MSAEHEHERRRPSLLRPLRPRLDVRARRFRRGVYLLPSMFTMANLFCGYACIVHSMRGELATAALFIGFAFVLDMLDGRIARMTGTTSAFGLEFDSLADVVSFGVAPAILSFQWGLHPLGRIGWAAGFLFVAAAAVRLARFNIQSGSQDKRYFVGMPSPAAACVPAATVFAYPQGFQSATACRGGAGHGHRAGADDGQHDSLPQLQDARPAGAPQFRGPRARRRWPRAPRRRTAVRARGDGVHLPGVRLHRASPGLVSIVVTAVRKQAPRGRTAIRASRHQRQSAIRLERLRERGA